MEDPNGPLWRAKGLHNKMAIRLWKSGEDFMGTINDINSAVDEIKSNNASSSTRGATCLCVSNVPTTPCKL